MSKILRTSKIVVVKPECKKKVFLLQVPRALLDKYISLSFHINFSTKEEKKHTNCGNPLHHLQFKQKSGIENEAKGSDETKLRIQRIYNVYSLLAHKSLSLQIL